MNVSDRPTLSRRLLAAGIAGALSLAPGYSAVAQCTSTLDDGYFQNQHHDNGRQQVRPPWHQAGEGTFDFLADGGTAHTAYLRKSTAGLVAIDHRVSLRAGSTYTLSSRVQTSPATKTGIFGFSDPSHHPAPYVNFGPIATAVYREDFSREVSVVFRPKASGRYLVFVGLYGSPDAWITVKEVTLNGGGCEDVNTTPG